MQINRRFLALALLVAAATSAGPALAVAPPSNRPVDRAGPTTAPDGSPLTPEDQQELKQMEDAVRSFEAATKDYRGTVTHIIKQDYDKKRRELIAKYDAQIKQVEQEEKDRRLEAIALFEKWLAKYPNDQKWTPDVVFRLAELYFERANDDYLAAVDAAQKAADEAQKAGKEAPAAPPTPDYTLTINLYKRLIAEFPTYRLIDGAFYLLGYCQGEMNHEPEAKQAYLALVCGNEYKALDTPRPPQPTKDKKATFVDPYANCVAIKDDSRFVPEAWTRIGEYHFDGNELELAIAAYARVLKYKDSPYYDKALYKLAWAYYRADRYPESIKKFDELVMFSDSKKTESGKEGSDLRQESVQYLGISFAEKDWNGDGVDDPETGLQRIEGFYRGRDDESHVRDIFQKLGDIYFDETEYAKAIEVYRRVLAKWPYAKENPKLQDRIVQADKRMRNEEAVLADTRELALKYGKGSEWYKKNRDDKAAVDAAAELAEQAMVTVAVEHHRRAQAMKKLALAKTPPDGVMLQRVANEYRLASEGYENYLQQFPNSKNTYDYTFFYAETLYYSGRFLDAAAQYEKVRDSNLDNRYLEDAAFTAVKSYENLVNQEVAQRKIVMPALPEVGKVQSPVTAQPVPDEVRKLQTAYDEYTKHVPQSGKVATMIYKAAEIDFKYLDFEKARARMEPIFEKYCAGNDIGAQAGSAIVAMYTIENNLDKILEWTDRLLKGKCGSAETVAANAGKLKDLSQDVRFQKAQKDFNDGKFEPAAEAFLKLVDEDPQNKSGNNDKALNNAAVAFEKVSRFQAATKVYERIVNEYPASPFVDDALFRTAISYARFFEFDKAVVSYQRLATDPKFAKSPNRTNALFNAAVILENDQNYAESARLFQQYAALKDPSLKRDEQGDAFFRSGIIYLKNKDPQKAMRTFQEYLRSWGTDPKKTIEAHYHIAEAHEQLKNHAAALKEYRQIEDEGARVPVASDAAEYPAKASFLLAEEELPVLEKMKISGDPKTLKKDIDKFQVEIAKLTQMYDKAISFRRATWALAAYFRIGYCYELLSRQLGAVANAPCPKDIERKYKQEGCDIYLQQLTEVIEKQVAPIDEEVVKRYRVTLEQAAKFGASNEWTRLARNRANAYKPDEFPLVKDERVDLQLENPL